MTRRGGTPGDEVRLVIKNGLPVGTDVGVHGIDVPFDVCCLGEIGGANAAG